MNNDQIATKYNLGAHVGFSKEMKESVKMGIDFSLRSIQLFLGNKLSYNRATLSRKDVSDTLDILYEYNMNIYSHFPYTSNLAGSKNNLAWSGDSSQDAKTSALISGITHELNQISAFNIPDKNLHSGVVIHPGNAEKTKEGLDTICTSINKITFPKNSVLLLENSSGSGTSLCRSFEEIKYIIDNIDECQKEHVNVCIDTCHLFCACTKYDLGKETKVIDMFNDMKHSFGMDKLKLIHLNDSLTPLGKKTDRHASLGNGHIWKNNEVGLKTFLSHIEQYKTLSLIHI